MAISHEAVFIQTPKITPMSFVNADGTTKKTIATAGANGSKVTSVIATSTDTSARNVQLWLTRSATSYLLGSANVPIGAGSDGAIVGVNIISTTLFPGLPVDNDGQPYIFLESGDTLQASMIVAVTAAKEVDVTAVFGNF